MKKGRHLFNMGFFCAGLMFVIFALVIFFTDIYYTNTFTSETTAVITKIISKEEENYDYDIERPNRHISITRYYADIEYLGRKTGRVSIAKDQYKVGDTITINYNPNNTNMIRLKKDNNYGVLIFIGIMLTISIPLFICSVIFKNSKEKLNER